MSQADVERFIELSAGIEPSSNLVSAVYSRTEGNPLFVNEVVRLLVQEGGLARGERDEATKDALRIPEGVREAIGRRLDRLSEESNTVLTVASVIGRSFSLDQLVRLIEDQTEDRLIEALEEALGARIIEELPGAVGQYQFNHALVQHTLADELSTTRRVRLHARIADTLEDLYGADADAHSEEIAHHLAEAASVGTGGKLVHYALTAGEQAMASHAHEEAVTQFERALSAKEGGRVDAETARLLLGLGRAQAAILQWQEAFDNMGRAMDYYIESGDAARAVAIGQHPLPSLTGLTGTTDLIVRALELVPADSHDAARLLVRYGSALHHERGDYDGAKEALGRALEIARREGDTALEVQALANAADMEAYQLQYPESMENSLAALELAGRVDEPHA